VAIRILVPVDKTASYLVNQGK